MYGVIKKEFIELTGICNRGAKGQHRERHFGHSSGRTLGEFPTHLERLRQDFQYLYDVGELNLLFILSSACHIGKIL